MSNEPYKRLPTVRLERSILKLILAENDIRVALEATQLLDNRLRERAWRPGQREVEALFESLIISYARPFSGSSQLRLPGQWPGYTRPELQLGHEQVIALRNQFVGHSDPGVRRVIINAAPDAGIRYSLNLAFFSPTLLWRVTEMSEDILARLSAEIAQAVEALFEREGLDPANGPVSIAVPRA